MIVWLQCPEPLGAYCSSTSVLWVMEPTIVFATDCFHDWYDSVVLPAMLLLSISWFPFRAVKIRFLRFSMLAWNYCFVSVHKVTSYNGIRSPGWNQRGMSMRSSRFLESLKNSSRDQARGEFNRGNGQLLCGKAAVKSYTFYGRSSILKVPVDWQIARL